MEKIYLWGYIIAIIAFLLASLFLPINALFIFCTVIGVILLLCFSIIYFASLAAIYIFPSSDEKLQSLCDLPTSIIMLVAGLYNYATPILLYIFLENHFFPDLNVLLGFVVCFIYFLLAIIFPPLIYVSCVVMIVANCITYGLFSIPAFAMCSFIIFPLLQLYISYLNDGMNHKIQIVFLCIIILSWAMVGYGTYQQLTTYDSSKTVYVGKTGNKYHQSDCYTLNGNGRKITLRNALDEGRKPCSICGG